MAAREKQHEFCRNNSRRGIEVYNDSDGVIFVVVAGGRFNFFFY